MLSKISMLESHPQGKGLPELFCEENYAKVRSFHQGLQEYKETPLVSLPGLADALGIQEIFVKDESARFGLKSCNVLGVSYAFHRVMDNYLEKDKPEIVAVSNGNHGRVLAWLAQREGYPVHIFMPKGTHACRVRQVTEIGDVQVEVTDKNYADTVKYAQEFAKKNRYVLFQNTAFLGYEKIPGDIALGYVTMAAETVEQLEKAGKKPTHIFIQAGSGTMACGLIAYLVDHYKEDVPKIAILEAEEAACFYTSVRRKKVTSIEGTPYTLMTELNCGTANIFAYPILHDFANYFFKCPDLLAIQGVRQFAMPVKDDPKIIAGPSGAVGLGLLLQLYEMEEYSVLRGMMDFDEDSIVLLFNTEGDTDPKAYQKIIETAVKQPENDLD